MRWHWEGVHAGVCQRMRSFTEQIVWARQLSLTVGGSVLTAAALAEGGVGPKGTEAVDFAAAKPPDASAAVAPSPMKIER